MNVDEMQPAEIFALIKERFGVEVKDENDIAAAWLVWDKMPTPPYSNGLWIYRKQKNGIAVCAKHDDYTDVIATGPAVITICRAALKALGYG